MTDTATRVERQILRAMLGIAADDPSMRRSVQGNARGAAAFALLSAALCLLCVLKGPGNGAAAAGFGVLAGLGAGLAVHFQLTLVKWPFVRRYLSASAIAQRLAELEQASRP